MAKFEKVSRFNEVELPMPVRKTVHSAGYDFVVAEDITIEPWTEMFNLMNMNTNTAGAPLTLEDVALVTKTFKAKPSLVSTGMKCELDEGTYLELSVRSSSPLKYWLLLANGVGIIDKDYYNNPDNEGEIFFQIYNLSPFPITLKKGDAIGQGIIHKYGLTEDDVATGERVGGFGSTSK
jgi:dUTP pyrophosphatase